MLKKLKDQAELDSKAKNQPHISQLNLQLEEYQQEFYAQLDELYKEQIRISKDLMSEKLKEELKKIEEEDARTKQEEEE